MFVTIHGRPAGDPLASMTTISSKKVYVHVTPVVLETGRQVILHSLMQLSKVTQSSTSKASAQRVVRPSEAVEEKPLKYPEDNTANV